MSATAEYVRSGMPPAGGVHVNPFRLLLIAIVAYALMTSSGLIVTLNLGGVTMSLAIRRSLSVEATIEQVDRYGLLLARCLRTAGS